MKLGSTSRTGPLLGLLLVAVLCIAAFAWRVDSGNHSPSAPRTTHAPAAAASREAQARRLLVSDPEVVRLAWMGRAPLLVVRPGASAGQLAQVLDRLRAWQVRRTQAGHTDPMPVLAMGRTRMDCASPLPPPAARLFRATGRWRDPALVDVRINPGQLSLVIGMRTTHEPLIVSASRIAHRLGALGGHLRSILDTVTISSVSDPTKTVWYAEGAFSTSRPVHATEVASTLADLHPTLRLTRRDVVLVTLTAPSGADLDTEWTRLRGVLGGVPRVWVQLRLDGRTWVGNLQGGPYAQA